MATKQGIISGIVQRVGSTPFTAWQIGITEDQAARKVAWKNDGKDVTCWTWWQADSSSDAKDIENYFINDKGMKGGTGGTITAATTQIYIF